MRGCWLRLVGLTPLCTNPEWFILVLPQVDPIIREVYPSLERDLAGKSPGKRSVPVAPFLLLWLLLVSFLFLSLVIFKRVVCI